LKDKLEKELDGILNRALQGLHRLFANNGKFTQTKAGEQALREYKLQNDIVAAYADEKLEESSPQSYIIRQDLRADFCDWCDWQGLNPVSARAFKESMYRLFPAVSEKRLDNFKPWAWLGIQFKK
jgi:phage/plasmid-associated DNA primase